MSIQGEQRSMFLSAVQEYVKDDPTLFTEIVQRMQQAIDDRLREGNEKRVEAETVAVMLFDLAPKAKLAKMEMWRVRIIKVICSTHLLSGTEYAKKLAATIDMETDKLI